MTTINQNISIHTIPENVKFGRIVLELHKLYYKNILSLKYNNAKIVGCNVLHVSDSFVNHIMNIIDNGIAPTLTELNSFLQPEREAYDKMLYVSQLNKRYNNTIDKTILHLKNKLKIVEGELNAGNNSLLLIKELKKIIYSLRLFHVINWKDMTEYLKQFQ
jgi:hypothetical protein